MGYAGPVNALMNTSICSMLDIGYRADGLEQKLCIKENISSSNYLSSAESLVPSQY